MRFLFNMLIPVILALPLCGNAEELKICEEGIDKCQPLVTDAEKYSKCMHLMCYDYYSAEAKKDKDESKFYFNFQSIQEEKPTVKKPPNETVRPCEYGLRKCDSLAGNQQYYWECIADTCKNPSDEKADCVQGQNSCVDRQKIYNDCMKLSCGDSAATAKSCPQGAASCSEDLRTYWQCVYKICLGPNDQYVRPATSKKFMIVTDKNGIKKRVQVNRPATVFDGAPSWLTTTPKGYSDEEWIRETPQKFRLIGNPSDYMQCAVPTAVLDCSQDDMRSCRCNDGTSPIMLNGAPSPYWKDN